MDARYAVVWRIGQGRAISGSLEVDDDALTLSGATAGDLRLELRELVAIEIGREPDQRVNGNRSLVLKRRGGRHVYVAALGGAGLLVELADLLQTLRDEHVARAQVVVVAPLRAGTAGKALALLEEGPPFVLALPGLERHSVFVSEGAVVFIFEGENAGAVVAELARNPSVFRAAVRWQGLLAGRPRLAREGFLWIRPK